MIIKKFTGLTKNVSKEELRKRIAQVGVISLGAIFIASNSLTYNADNNDISKTIEEKLQQEENIVANQVWSIKEIQTAFKNLEQRRLEEKKYSLLSYRILVENFPDGTVRHHFVNSNKSLDSYIELEKNEKYNKWYYEYKSITDKDFVVPYSEIFYNTTDYYEFIEIPETDGQYIFDYNVPYYVMDATDIVLPNGYSLEQLYSVNDLKALEEKLNASIYENKDENQIYYTFNLLLAEVNGEFMCFDFTGLYPEVDETTDVEDVTKLRTVYYIPCVGNYLMNLKISSGMTKVEDYIKNINSLNINEHYVIEDITSLEQTIRNDLRGNTVTFKSLYRYLEEKNDYVDIQITKEELDQIVEELNNQNRKRTLLKDE